MFKTILNYPHYLRYLKKKNELKESFQNFCEIKNPEQLKISKKLVEQEGKINSKIENLTNTENQRDFSIKFYWGHNHYFNDSFYVKGKMGDRHINLMAEFLLGFNLHKNFFKNKDCIDVGSWTGGTTLMLKHLGAAEVLALEEVQKYAKTLKSLAKNVYNFSDVKSEGVNIFNLKTKKKYDIAYFPGVIYHLSDPVLGLRRLYNSLKSNGFCLVETAGIDSKKSIAKFDGNYIFTNNNPSKNKLNRSGWNWFSPSPKCLERWMIEAGFEDVKTYYSFISKRVYGIGKRKKFKNICRAGLSVFDV